MTLTKDDIVSAIEQMTVIDLADLVKVLEQRLGVSAAAPVSVAAPGAGLGAAAVEAPPEEEQSEFTVVLKEIGPNKINVIKAVRELVPGLGLKEAKDLVEAAPKEIKEGVTKEDAQGLRAKLEEVGAVVEVR